ncbi:carboxypeptidase-like regulatory domain-containing protein [Pedobacter psychrodurus]|uniref:carboxypeptidase-like regulatory domain-containing protein n=1 Tax=Pedobacter psychrodurus TaxID=2530456 RepID=UPI00292EE118|nr:carboxypeptidase-like regulatory domain-containing protein [Pedobacter psychrodurus]
MPYHLKIISAIFISCFFILPRALAQQMIKGQVVNEANKGIASVSIYNKQKLIALSDPEGNFSFKIDSLNKGQSLSFSSVGYESHSVKVDERSIASDLIVKLKDKYVKLDDVHIYPANFAATLMKNAIAHLADTGVVSEKLLCRQYMVKDGKYYSYAEGLLNLHTDEYKNDIKLQLDGLRRLKELKKTGSVKINYAVDLRIELKSYFVSNLNDNMLSEDNDYEIEGQVEYEDTKCYKISFTRARNVVYKRKNGWVYITVDKHLIKGMESNIATINKSMIWINRQNYSIENGLAKLSSTYLKCNVVAGLFSEGEPSAEMELLFLENIDPEQKNNNNYSTLKLRQDFYLYPKKNNVELWTALYQKHNLSIPKVIVETYKSDKDILEQF